MVIYDFLSREKEIFVNVPAFLENLWTLPFQANRKQMKQIERKKKRNLWLHFHFYGIKLATISHNFNEQKDSQDSLKKEIDISLKLIYE